MLSVWLRVPKRLWTHGEQTRCASPGQLKAGPLVDEPPPRNVSPPEIASENPLVSLSNWKPLFRKGGTSTGEIKKWFVALLVGEAVNARNCRLKPISKRNFNKADRWDSLESETPWLIRIDSNETTKSTWHWYAGRELEKSTTASGCRTKC